MKKTLWYMYKPGDIRDYAMTTPPSPSWSEAMAAQGFKLFECLVDIPKDEITVEGYGDEAAPAREVSLTAVCTVSMCHGCGAGIGDRHTTTCTVLA